MELKQLIQKLKDIKSIIAPLPSIASELTLDEVKNQTNVRNTFFKSSKMKEIVTTSAENSFFGTRTQQSYLNNNDTNYPFKVDYKMYPQLIEETTVDGDSVILPEIYVVHERSYKEVANKMTLVNDLHVIDYTTMRLKGFTHFHEGQSPSEAIYSEGSDILLVAFMCSLRDIYKEWKSILSSEFV